MQPFTGTAAHRKGNLLAGFVSFMNIMQSKMPAGVARLIIVPAFTLTIACQSTATNQQTANSAQTPEQDNAKEQLVLGAEQFGNYVPLIKNDTIALVVNQTSRVGNTHLVDTLLSRGIAIKHIFAPEHGFRGDAADGEKVKDGRDTRTGLPIISLYGSNRKPQPEQLEGIQTVIFDIQDVGTRFYTYISTMHLVMEACAEAGIRVIVLDRPNPNGDYIDGPVREEKWKSFVGMHPIPAVHGLTVGELARMINGEGWLETTDSCRLNIITMQNYHHKLPYQLPINPSPNLPNQQAIRLYPSLCLFEGTMISVGRGTDFPFQAWGYPNPVFTQTDSFQFKPVKIPGVSNYPPHENKICYGTDLRNITPPGRFSLEYLLTAYRVAKDNGLSGDFFNSYFPKLAGTATLQQQIEAGEGKEIIRASWQPGLKAYREMRKQYLLYP